MAEYYLVSQLPSLDGISENTPLPIEEERFFELCERFLGKKAKNELSKVTLMPGRAPEKSSSPVIEAWNEGERQLRLALAKLRADKMNKQFTAEIQSIPATILQAAKNAVEIESPLEAEKYLNKVRLDFLETLRPMDSFSEDFVYYYGIKLKIIERIRKFDTKSGKNAYRKIYDSIMNEEERRLYNARK